MNVDEIKQNTRRKSFQQNDITFNNMNNSNFQVIKSSKRKSISSKKNPIFKSKKTIYKNQKQKFIPKNINLSPNLNPIPHHINTNFFNIKVGTFKEETPKNNNDLKLGKQRRFSLQSNQLLNRKKNNFQSNKKIDDFIEKKNNFIEKKILRNSICKLENNIKLVLNNMRIEIEKKGENDNDKDNNIQKIMTRQKKLSISPFIRIKNKENLEIVNQNNPSDMTFSVIKIKTLKRSHSFVLSEHSKQKIVKRLKNKIKASIKNKTLTLTHLKETIIEENTFENDEEESDNSIGYSLDPDGYFILIYDTIIILVNFLNSIFIPLRIAKNEDIRGSNSFLNILLLYLIDFIYLADLIIGFFRGFYNHEMKYIRKTKHIIKNYLNGDFFLDLIEAVPINLIIRLRIFHQTYIICESYVYHIIFLKLLILVKTFKIIKITREKKMKH